MAWNNTFRLIWWGALLLALTAYLLTRVAALTSGTLTVLDTAAGIAWIALMLAPIFSEIAFAGVTLKTELKDLKAEVKEGQAEVKEKLAEIRLDVVNAVNVRNTNSNTINVYREPPTDAELPAIKRQVLTAAAEIGTSRTKGLTDEAVPAPSDDVTYLFNVRRAIESEVRRIAGRGAERRSVSQLLLGMTLAGQMSIDLQNAILDVYAVCTPAIHGDAVTPAQVQFVRDVSPSLLATLQGL